MSRLFAILGTVVFSLGTLAGLVLIVMETLDGNLRLAGSAAVGTVVFAGGAWCFRRDWQRANQARDFHRENSSPR